MKHGATGSEGRSWKANGNRAMTIQSRLAESFARFWRLSPDSLKAVVPVALNRISLKLLNLNWFFLLAVMGKRRTLFAQKKLTSIVLLFYKFIHMSTSQNNSSSSNHSDKDTNGDSSDSKADKPQPQKEKLIFPVSSNASEQFSEQPSNLIEFSSDTTSSDGE